MVHRPALNPLRHTSQGYRLSSYRKTTIMATPHHFLDKAVPHYCWPGCLCLSGLSPRQKCTLPQEECVQEQGRRVESSGSRVPQALQPASSRHGEILRRPRQRLSQRPVQMHTRVRTLEPARGQGQAGASSHCKKAGLPLPCLGGSERRFEMGTKHL